MEPAIHADLETWIRNDHHAIVEKDRKQETETVRVSFRPQQLTMPDQRLPSEPSEPLLTYTPHHRAQGTVSGPSSPSGTTFPCWFLTAG